MPITAHTHTLVPGQQASAEADWERESQGLGYLTKERLFDSLFETTDIWCDDIGAQVYCLTASMLWAASEPPIYPYCGLTTEYRPM